MPLKCSSGARSGVRHCRTPERTLCCATSRRLPLGHRTAGDPATRGLHADRGHREVGVPAEPPATVGDADGGRADESPRTGASGSGAIVDLDTRSKASVAGTTVDAFHTKLSIVDPELG